MPNAFDKLPPLKSEGTSTEYIGGAYLSHKKPPTWRELVEAKILQIEGENAVISGTIGALSGTSDQYTAHDPIAWTVWTAGYVYFPAGYDGSVWVAFAPRHPNNMAVKIVGGGVE